MKDLIPIAGNGLLDRRAFLRGGAAFAAAMTTYSAKAETLTDPAWSKQPDELVPAYGGPSKYEKAARTLSNPKGDPLAERAAPEDHGRRGGRARPDGRARDAGRWLSDAASPARLGRQHEREVAAAPRAHRAARHELLRVAHLHADRAGRQGVPLLFR